MVAKAVEATHAQKAMNQVLEATATSQAKASGTSRDMQMRIRISAAPLRTWAGVVSEA